MRQAPSRTRTVVGTSGDWHQETRITGGFRREAPEPEYPVRSPRNGPAPASVAPRHLSGDHAYGRVSGLSVFGHLWAVPWGALYERVCPSLSDSDLQVTAGNPCFRGGRQGSSALGTAVRHPVAFHYLSRYVVYLRALLCTFIAFQCISLYFMHSRGTPCHLAHGGAGGGRFKAFKGFFLYYLAPCPCGCACNSKRISQQGTSKKVV